MSKIISFSPKKENDKMSNYISVAFLVLVGLSFLGL